MYNGGVSQPLAKVLDDETLSGARGPDGLHEIVVPAREYSPVSMIRTINAQMSPYSTAVAPRLSANNAPRRFIYAPSTLIAAVVPLMD